MNSFDTFSSVPISNKRTISNEDFLKVLHHIKESSKESRCGKDYIYKINKKSALLFFVLSIFFGITCVMYDSIILLVIFFMSGYKFMDISSTYHIVDIDSNTNTSINIKSN